VDAAVFAFGDLTADGLAVVNLRAIGAEIEPALVGILGDDAVGGADEACLVLLVVARHREFEHVAGVAFHDVLQNGAVLHETRRDRFHVRHAGVEALNDVDLALLLQRQAERQRDALHRREMSIEGAEAFRIARHLVEQDRRRGVVAALGQHLRDAAHFRVPMRAVDVQQFADALHLVEPAPQAVAIMDLRFEIGIGESHECLLDVAVRPA
jgi:hypothetical protein